MKSETSTPTRFDLLIVAGPRVDLNSTGPRLLASLCAEWGLTVGHLDVEGLATKGVIPLPNGAEVVAEDSQSRLHRFHARSVVRWVHPDETAPLFEGSRTEAVLPLSTAWKLLSFESWSWEPGVIILGTSNAAFRFGSLLLEQGVSVVYCVKETTDTQAPIVGHEIERRRFESRGGKILVGQPLSVRRISALRWEFRLQDALGVRLLETARVISTARENVRLGAREYPEGSFLFEVEKGGALAFAGDGFDERAKWLEEERARWLACRVARGLISDLAPIREDVDRHYRRAKRRLAFAEVFASHRIIWRYEGKWLTAASRAALRAHSSVPKQAQQVRDMASLECIEPIACSVCIQVCPEKAIERNPQGDLVLKEDLCTACGLCVPACPSSSITLLYEKEAHAQSTIVLPIPSTWSLRVTEQVTLLNRRGESLGSGRVQELGAGRVKVVVPSHLIWEARAIRKPKADLDPAFEQAEAPQTEKVSVVLGKDRRLLRAKIPLSLALFEVGMARGLDKLDCRDGSCGLCRVEVDGVKKYACQTPIRQGMAIKLDEKKVLRGEVSPKQPFLCPCLGITESQVLETLSAQQLASVEAVLRQTHVGEGRCHGLHCMGLLLALLKEHGISVGEWVDWGFPTVEWVVTRNRNAAKNPQSSG